MRFLGMLILSNAFLRLALFTKSKALEMSKEANHSSSFKIFDLSISFDTIAKGSIVLWPGSPVKLNSDRTLLSLRALVNLLLRVPVKTFLTDSIKEIGLVLLSL